MPALSWRQGACVLAAFVLVAMVQSWPLPLHLATHLTGPPVGDTGVYVWNLWVFRQELIDHAHLPWQTMAVLPLSGPIDLSLHNYTVFADVLALPFPRSLGIIATFNVIYLLNATLAGFGLFLLARRLTGRVAESFLAGLLFACSPFLVARSAGHFSLAAAAPLPFFLFFLYRMWDTRRVSDACGAGLSLAWAAFCDPYYAVYCAMLGAAFVGSRVVAVTLQRRAVGELASARFALNAALAATMAGVLVLRGLAGGSLQLGGLHVSMQTLYTPMLLITALATARWLVSRRVRISLELPPSRLWLPRVTLAAVATAAIVLSPQLYALGERVATNTFVTATVHWRSSAPGVDLLSFFLPNPNHPLAPEAWRSWLAAGSEGWVEQVASLSWVGLAVLAAAWRWSDFRPGRFWPTVTIGFGLLALGPFAHVAGINTHVPTPWAFLRYVPIIGAARMPTRFAAVVILGFAVLFALALTQLGRRFPERRRLLLAIVGLALVAELLPAPRPLYAASVPAFLSRIAADPRPVRVLNLPIGVRDGLSSLGNASGMPQFHQTFHGKGLVGGYLSRVSERRKDAYRRNPVMHALLAISEGRKLSPHEIDRAIGTVDRFLETLPVGYVIMETSRVSDDLRDFATLLLGLTKVDEADGYELYVPRGQPLPPTTNGR
jgi:hypothetical protein